MGWYGVPEPDTIIRWVTIRRFRFTSKFESTAPRWDQVGPERYGCQAIYLRKKGVLPFSIQLALAPGMCFSFEPMICGYGEFGMRLED